MSMCLNKAIEAELRSLPGNNVSNFILFYIIYILFTSLSLNVLVSLLSFSYFIIIFLKYILLYSIVSSFLNLFHFLYLSFFLSYLFTLSYLDLL